MLSMVFIGCVYGESLSYKDELLAFKKSEKYKAVFDKEIDVTLHTIYRDVENFKHLPSLQRFFLSIFLSLDVIMVTPHSMPRLYAYVQDLCERHAIAMPPIFITIQKNIFNAFALKLLATTGGVLIGQKLLLEATDEELEGVIAHELGHIKHNHTNKSLALYFAVATIATLVQAYYLPHKIKDSFQKIVFKEYLSLLAVGLITSIIINKRFEREADEFACKDQHAAGLIQFFKHLLQKEKVREASFIDTYEHIQKNSNALSSHDHRSLLIRYYIARGQDYLLKGYKWLYHNTPLGAHPSHEERIVAAQRYLS